MKKVNKLLLKDKNVLIDFSCLDKKINYKEDISELKHLIDFIKMNDDTSAIYTINKEIYKGNINWILKKFKSLKSYKKSLDNDLLNL